MEVLNNEVEKLSAYLKMNGRSALTVSDVELISSPTVECDAFALSNAVIEKNSARAFSIS
jgi:DNA polymerase III delta subunit